MTDPPLVFENVPVEGHRDATLSLAIPEHATASIVGDAASGVNHLAAMAIGLLPTGRGRVLVLGEDIGSMPRRAALAFRRRVGYVPAGDGLLQNLSLADNVALPLRFGSAMAPREIEGRLLVMLAQARLTNAAHLRPADANVELRRRTALARALAFDPDLVILDRPFDGIPARAQIEVLDAARGGETTYGGRRTVFITGQFVPERVRPRIEHRYRLARGDLRTLSHES